MIVSLGIVLTACSSTPPKEEIFLERSVSDLYDEALDALEKQEYRLAIKSFEELERQHPYSKWAIKAQLMSAYAHYMRGRYGDAIITLENFIELNPGHEDIAYAYYLRGLSYYEQISDISRDQYMATMALTYLQEVVDRFPNSDYARDSLLKIDACLDQIAGHNMEIGRFYQSRGDHLAAINRFEIVTTQYERTVHTPEALFRMTESYVSLGLFEDARKPAAVLGYNFSASEWYQRAYALLTVEGIAPAKFSPGESSKLSKYKSVKYRPTKSVYNTYDLNTSASYTEKFANWWNSWSWAGAEAPETYVWNYSRVKPSNKTLESKDGKPPK